ncbi:hypothetical protein NDU88_001325 [Pleurodeles waltl]|uniref:Uncharacterized protein n=1 Tax=Pleurodeles waltl TaxID=8319 RepID=A0AAV7UT11_PLEWA|nr:hypothetical protein NDU88_001325 [Pleurodeles waltl]
MQQSLIKTDGKIDVLTFRLDRLVKRIDKHAECLDQAECRLCEVEDKQVSMAALQKKADTLLIVLQAKIEDLEVLQNNIQLVGVTESTNISNMEQFVEELLIDLLDRETFSDMFMVARAHCALASRQVLGALPGLQSPGC